MADEKVLNPRLYARLQRVFGEVKIRNPGEARVVRASHFREGTTQVVQWGEQYLVGCPFCRNAAYRLSISYQYGLSDEKGRPNIYLAKCHARDCLADRENRVALAAKLSDGRASPAEDRVRPGKVISDDERRIDLPGSLTRVDQLANNHSARLFLSDRGLDPDRVGRFYGVSYCADSDDFLTRGRLIIPVRQRNQLKGWQSLAIGQT